MALEPSTARGRATRDRIVQAATVVVKERGVALTTLDAVQDAAGVGRSQMYHYFDDRDDLMRAVVGATVDAVLTHQDVLRNGIDSLADIDRWFAEVVANSWRQDSFGGCSLGSLASQLAEHDEVTRGAFVAAFERWQAPLIAGLDRMQRRGELRPDVRVNDLADITMAAIQGGLLLAQIRRNPDQVRLALEGARAALLPALTQNAVSAAPAR